MKTKAKAIQEHLHFFIEFLREYNRYFEIKDKIAINPEIRMLFQEIEMAPSLLSVINAKTEEIARQKEEKQSKPRFKNAILFSKEEDNLSPHSKLYQCKRAVNPNCFGQRSMDISLHLFNGKDEMRIMSNLIIRKIKKVLRESYSFASADAGIDYLDEGQYVMRPQSQWENKAEQEKKRYLNPMFNNTKTDINQIRIMTNDNIIQSYKKSVINKQKKDKQSHVENKSRDKESPTLKQCNNSSNQKTKLPSYVERNQAVCKFKTSANWNSEHVLDKQLFGKKKSNKAFNPTNPAIGRHYDYTELFSLRIMR